MAKKENSIHFLNSYPASTLVVPEVIEKLITDLRASGYHQEEIEEIVLSMDEAITNAVQITLKTNQAHRQNQCSDDRCNITVRYAITPALFDATIIDHGRGLDIFNVVNETPRSGSPAYANQILRYATESEQSKLTVRVNGQEVPLRGIGAGLKIILNFMDQVTIDLIDKQTVLSRTVTEHTDGTIFNMKRSRRHA